MPYCDVVCQTEDFLFQHNILHKDKNGGKMPVLENIPIAAIHPVQTTRIPNLQPVNPKPFVANAAPAGPEAARRAAARASSTPAPKAPFFSAPVYLQGLCRPCFCCCRSWKRFSYFLIFIVIFCIVCYSMYFVAKHEVKGYEEITSYKKLEALTSKALNSASWRGNVKDVEALLSNGAHLFKRKSIYDASPLHNASMNNHVQVVRLLLEAGLDVDAIFLNNGPGGSGGETPLAFASSLGHLQVVEELVAAGANLSLSERNINEDTPLYKASRNGHLSVVQFLLSKGAPVHLNIANDTSCLHTASIGGHVDIVIALLKHGADVHLTTAKGWTPLHYAAVFNHLAVMELLIEMGADINQMDSVGYTSYDFYKYALGENAKRDITGNLYEDEDIFIAAFLGHTARVSKLIKAGTDVNIASDLGDATITALHLASQNGHLIIVNLLLSAGSNVDAELEDGATSLFLASENGLVKVVRALLKAGASSSISVHNTGYTPLHIACVKGNFEVLELLLAAVDADVSTATLDGFTPLHLVSRYGHADLVGPILSAKGHADINAGWNSVNGVTPLYVASVLNQVEVVEKLLSLGASMVTKDTIFSPFVAACEGGHFAVITLLLKAGGNASLMDTTCLNGFDVFTMAKTHDDTTTTPIATPIPTPATTTTRPSRSPMPSRLPTLTPRQRSSSNKSRRTSTSTQRRRDGETDISFATRSTIEAELAPFFNIPEPDAAVDIIEEASVLGVKRCNKNGICETEADDL